MHNKDKIILIGFMGTGKSSVATKLSQRLAIKHLDLDQEIVNAAGCTISQIFESHGEDEFRNYESNILKQLLEQNGPAVIATGGGAVLRSQNCELMKRYGFVVALHATKEVIVQRVSQDRGRPLLAGDVEQRVTALLEARRGAYDFAHLSIDTSNLSLDQIVNQIVDSWQKPI